MKNALNLGCGYKKVEIGDYEVFHVDIRPEVKPDFVQDVRHLVFELGSFDLIYSSHLLEHLGREELPLVIEHWKSFLKPGGMLITIVPDLGVAISELVNGVGSRETWDILYGGQANPHGFHKMGFTSNSLIVFLERHGFVIEKTENKNREIHCTARRGEKT